MSDQTNEAVNPAQPIEQAPTGGPVVNESVPAASSPAAVVEAVQNAPVGEPAPAASVSAAEPEVAKVENVIKRDAEAVIKELEETVEHLRAAVVHLATKAGTQAAAEFHKLFPKLKK